MDVEAVSSCFYFIPMFECIQEHTVFIVGAAGMTVDTIEKQKHELPACGVN